MNVRGWKLKTAARFILLLRFVFVILMWCIKICHKMQHKSFLWLLDPVSYFRRLWIGRPSNSVTFIAAISAGAQFFNISCCILSDCLNVLIWQVCGSKIHVPVYMNWRPIYIRWINLPKLLPPWFFVIYRCLAVESVWCCYIPVMQ